MKGAFASMQTLIALSNMDTMDHSAKLAVCTPSTLVLFFIFFLFLGGKGGSCYVSVLKITIAPVNRFKNMSALKMLSCRI